MNILGVRLYFRHAKRILRASLIISFLATNWGSTLPALRQAWLGMLTLKQGKLAPEVQSATLASLVPLSQTMANLTLWVLIWFISHWMLRQFDPKWRQQDAETSVLRNENELLRNSILESNRALQTLSESLQEVVRHNEALDKHRDKIVDLSFEIEKINLKPGKGSVQKKQDPSLNGQDLFSHAKRNRPRPPKRKLNRFTRRI